MAPSQESARHSSAKFSFSRAALGSFLVATMLLSSIAADAAEISSHKTESGSEVILVSGGIASDDDDKFRKIAAGIEKAVVVLDSPGGLLLPALEIGKIIQIKGFTTYVPAASTCTSSCALIWVAGSTRFLASDGKIGFHASYRDQNGKAEEAGVGNAIVGRYLTLLNLPEKAVIFATSASPSAVLWLTPENSSDVGINFERLDLPEDRPQDNTAPVAETRATETRSENNFDWIKGVWSVWGREGTCSVAAFFDKEQDIDNESSVSVTIFKGKDTAFLLITNEKFKSLMNHEIYKLELLFQRRGVFDRGWGLLNFKSSTNKSRNGLGANLKVSPLLMDFKSNDFIVFKKDGVIIDLYPLAGSAEALLQLDKCVLKLNGALADPFAR